MIILSEAPHKIVPYEISAAVAVKWDSGFLDKLAGVSQEVHA